MAHLLVAFWLSFGSFVSVAGQSARCFDFQKKVTDTLKPPMELEPSRDLVLESGKEGKRYWGAARMRVDQPIERVYEWLLVHSNWKDPEKTELSVLKKSQPGYEEFHELTVDVSGIPLISVSWTEEWAYRILEGTLKQPKKILVSYQKIHGTSYVKHLCGSILLKRLSSGTTDGYFYEESEAWGQSDETILKMHSGNFEVLKKL